MMKKRLTNLLLACVLALSLFGFAACSKNGDELEDTADVKVVKVWLHKSEAEPEGRIYRTIADMFNEKKLHTKDGRTIMMSLEFKNSSDALDSSINGELLGGGLPDIVAVDSPNITAYAAQEIILPLDEHLTDDVKNSYVDSVITQSTYNDKLFALSGMDAPGGLYYNKELLKSVGYTDADFGTIENPWSWKDVEEAMDKLKAANKTYKIKLNLGFGGAEGCMYLYSPLIYSAGGQFTDTNEKAVGALNSEASLGGLSMLESIYEQDSAKSWIYNGTNVNAFPGGEVAFEIYGPWLIDTIRKDYKDFQNKYDIMPFPVYESADGTKGKVQSPCGSWGFAVTRDTRDAYAASQAVAFLTGTEASQLMYDSIGTFPTHKSLLDNEENFGSGASKSLSELLLQTGAPRPRIEKYPQLTTAFSDIVNYIKTAAGTSDYNLAKYALQKAQSVDR